MKKIYAIYDRVAKEIVGLQMYALFLFRTDNQAARYFSDAINDKTSILHKHPSDYDLRCIGHITEEGNIVPQDPEKNIVLTGDALLAAQEQSAPDQGRDGPLQLKKA